MSNDWSFMVCILLKDKIIREFYHFFPKKIHYIILFLSIFHQISPTNLFFNEIRKFRMEFIFI
jgi:hypothetical protein